MPPVPYRTKSKARLNKPFTVNQLKTMQRLTAKQVARSMDARLFSHTVNGNLLHGNHYVWNPAFNVVQGTNNNNRIASELFLDGFLFNLLVELPNTSAIGSISYRIKVYADHDNTFSGSGTTVVQQINMQSVGYLTIGNTCTQPNDKWQTRTLLDQVITVDCSNNTGRNQAVMRKWIPVKKKISYDTAGFLKLENYYFVVSPWISNGTLNTTAVGYFDANVAMYFKE